MTISKRDFFSMTRQQAAAGREMWRRTGQEGRLAKSSFNAEERAPKAWILYANRRGEEISTIECELYTVGRQSDPTEGLVMLIGMCPKCGEHFIAREDNKTMYIETLRYRQAPPHIKVNWDYHCANVLGRRVSDDDKVLVVSSPERWACDYCKSWCVKVHGGVAVDDHRGVTQITVPMGVPIVGQGGDEKAGKVEF